MSESSSPRLSPSAMATQYVARKRLFHHGVWIEPGSVVEDAASWQSLRVMLGSGRLEAVEVEGEGDSLASPSTEASDSAEEQHTPLVDMSADELMSLHKAVLIDMAVENGVESTGTKADIVARLV